MIYTHRESAKNYIFVIQVFSSDYRLVECPDHIQWIVQKNTGNRWRGVRFFKTKAALVKYLGGLGLCVDELADLPDNFRSQFGFGQVGNEELCGRLPCEVRQRDSDHADSGCTEGL